MSKINFISFCILIFLLGCANSYKLEKKPELNILESYYKTKSSGVRGGDSGYSIYLMLDENTNLDTKNIKIKGIYFKDKYADLKNQGLGKYQTFIKQDNNTDSLEPVFNSKKSVEIQEEKIPFVLKDTEAVISYLQNEKMKFFKVALTKKKTMDFPM